jgi:hypothetical protein
MRRLAALLFALVALPASAQTWEAHSGQIYRIPGAPEWFQVMWGAPDAAGDYLWRHLPADDYRFRAVRMIWTAGVGVAQRKDGSCIVPRSSMVTACPAAIAQQPGAIAQQPAPAPVPAPVPPPVVASPPLPAPLPAPAHVRVDRILVVPMQYENDLGYAPKVTQEALTAVFAEAAAWWAKESYGRARMEVVVLPTMVFAKAQPGCNSGAISNDAAATNYAGVYPNFTNGYHPELDFRARIYVTTPGCWQGHMATGGNMIFSWSIYPDSAGKFLHEIGHAVGFGHTGGQLVPGGPIATYGSWYDQMGVGGASTGIAHFNAPHKARLQWLTFMLCADATLRNLEDYPDAISCQTGSFQTWIEYHDDHSVFVHEQRSGGDPAFGLDDNIWVARLLAGQSYKMADGRTLTHVGNGQVTIR